MFSKNDRRKILATASLMAAGFVASGFTGSLAAFAETRPTASVEVASSSYGIARQAASVVVMRDIALQTGNTLHGQVVDSEGMAQANYEVWITRDNGVSLRTRTDASGRFTATELTPGDYRIETAAGGGKYRLWAPSSAPTDAASNVLLIVTLRVAG